jgi:hypothetical protein
MPKFTVVVVSLGYASYATEREILKPIDAELVLAPSDCLTGPRSWLPHGRRTQSWCARRRSARG